nr:hypothetical protein [Lentzea aerocolonigenes]
MLDEERVAAAGAVGARLGRRYERLVDRARIPVARAVHAFEDPDGELPEPMCGTVADPFHRLFAKAGSAAYVQRRLRAVQDAADAPNDLRSVQDVVVVGMRDEHRVEVLDTASGESGGDDSRRGSDGAPEGDPEQ